MLLRSTSLAFFILLASGEVTFGDDLETHKASGAPAPGFTRPHTGATKGKPLPSASTAGSVGEIDFSQPYAPASSPQKSSNPAPAAQTRNAPVEPQGGVSLDLKWHATNDKADPYDAVRHTSGPDGPGDGVAAGVKLGF
jgi:hypothetical protein